MRWVRFSLFMTLTSVGPLSAAHAAVVPPAVLTREDAESPPEAVWTTQDPVTVVLTCTIAEDGHVTGLDVVESGGPALDGAALRALSRWTFTAARKDGARTSDTQIWIGRRPCARSRSRCWRTFARDGWSFDARGMGILRRSYM